ncbi:hypothetical protein HDU67_008361, partial [Dinochytrium kinnereticum]
MPNRLPPRDARNPSLDKGRSHDSLSRSRRQVNSAGGGDSKQRDDEERYPVNTLSPHQSSSRIITKSVDSLSKRSPRVFTTVDIDGSAPASAVAMTPLTGKTELLFALSTGQALSPAASRVILANSRDVLGSSFQLTHVVPEEDEGSKVPTRLPSEVGGLRRDMEEAFAGMSVEEDGDGGVRDLEEGGVILEEAEEGGGLEEVEKSGNHPNFIEDTHSPPPAQSRDSLPLPPTPPNQPALLPGFYKSDEDLLQMAFGTVNRDRRVQVAFRDLGFEVGDGKGGRKDVLRGVTGVFRPGRVTAIMGASGAGKTSLLNVIAGETKSGKVSGSILVNGREMSGEQIRDI